MMIAQEEQEELRTEFEEIVRTVYSLQRERPQSWPTWLQVSKRCRGTEEFAEQLSGIARLPDYTGYFAFYHDKSVKLSGEGMELNRSIAAQPLEDSNSPQTVAEAIRRYAARLKRYHLKVERIAHVIHLRGKVVQAFHVDMEEASIAGGTPVEYRPANGAGKTRGKVVGQNPETACVYVSSETEVFTGDVPGILAVDSGYMHNELARRILARDGVPPLVEPLVATELARHSALEVPSADEAANVLADLPRPWTKLLWGPPGAGKTFAIARFVAAFIRRDPSARVLLLAPSNGAVDVLVDEIAAAIEHDGLGKLINDRRILRYGYAEKESVLNRPELLGPCEAVELTRDIQAKSKKLVLAEREEDDAERIATLRAELLASQEELARLVQDHIAQASIVASTTHLGFLPASPIGKSPWSIVAVDEVTMVPPATCYFLGSLARDGFLLAGDPRQLGPVTEHEQSLGDGERKWMGTDIFEFAGASTGIGDDRQIDCSHPLLVRITEQRRCHPRIWAEIQCAYPGVHCTAHTAEVNEPTGMERTLPGRVVLLDTAGTQVTDGPCRPEKGSWYNRSTAELCVELATTILGEDGSRTVAIITPFRAQRARLSRLVRNERAMSSRFDQIQVGTVHQFQGSAADIVIFDVVEDSARRHLTKVLHADAGIRLVNVAISRARSQLIIVANREWHKRHTNRSDNPLLWHLIVERPDDETIAVLDARKQSPPCLCPYESPYEAILGSAMKVVPELRDVVPQHSIRREDGRLISRADFAIPNLKYAIYVDGAAWHLTAKTWRRDQRLRGELRDLGWSVSVFGAHEVESSPQACVGKIAQSVRRLLY